MAEATEAPAGAKECYLIVLEGQGDVYAHLVDRETWDWINRDDSVEREASDGAWNEIDIAPAALREAERASHAVYVAQQKSFGREDDSVPQILVTCGSADNHRAMALCKGATLWSYDYATAGDEEPEDVAKAWAREHGYTIVETYEGYIY